MKIILEKEKLSSIKADVTLSLVTKDSIKKYSEDKQALFRKLGFKAEDTQSLFLQEDMQLLIAVDDVNNYNSLREACFNASLWCDDKKISSIKVSSYIDKCSYESTKAMVEGFIFGEYKFENYKSKKTKTSLSSISISTIDNFTDKKIDIKQVQKAIDDAQAYANATIFTRDLVNEIPYVITPKELANRASKLAKEYDLECNILDKKELKKLNMNAFLAVAKASSNPARLIHLKYRHKNAKKNIVLVGKGLTYDSGGLSLKPADFMVTMKCDKSGACATLGVIKGVCELNLPINLDIIIGAAENMIGGNAYKPDDVLISRSKKTIEVRNTDAEGRLVLADCLTYAQDMIKDIDYIFDYATLTGACAVALGQYTSGVMGHNQELKNSFSSQGNKQDDLMNPLNFNRHLSKLIKSNIADVCNIASSRYGGALTAGLFLDNFIKKENKEKWLHVDIAGPAYVESNWGFNKIGASGAGVRATLAWLQNNS